MKKSEMIGEGIIGMKVEFNLQDMHAAAQIVNIVEKYYEEVKAHREWADNMGNKDLRIKIDPETGEQTELWGRWDRNAYCAIYPEPEVYEIDKDDILDLVCKFFKKIASKPENEATIFEDEDKKNEQ